MVSSRKTITSWDRWSCRLTPLPLMIPIKQQHLLSLVIPLIWRKRYLWAYTDCTFPFSIAQLNLRPSSHCSGSETMSGCNLIYRIEHFFTHNPYGFLLLIFRVFQLCMNGKICSWSLVFLKKTSFRSLPPLAIHSSPSVCPVSTCEIPTLVKVILCN